MDSQEAAGLSCCSMGGGGTQICPRPKEQTPGATGLFQPDPRQLQLPLSQPTTPPRPPCWLGGPSLLSQLCLFWESQPVIRALISRTSCQRLPEVGAGPGGRQGQSKVKFHSLGPGEAPAGRWTQSCPVPHLSSRPSHR